ncbi:hypothetical protein [Paenibacillus sp. FSL K6-2524]|uniref:hypothetical protein n=1 Tax=Paenibacillus sp. FSL K6-2524 TaxID=2954516 RepID=UPI0030FB53B7
MDAIQKELSMLKGALFNTDPAKPSILSMRLSKLKQLKSIQWKKYFPWPKKSR